MAEVVWTERARQDLKEIVDFIARDSKAYAQSFGLLVREKTGRLETFPESGPAIPEDPSGSTRQVIVGNYRLLYRHAGERVIILTVVHGARNLGSSG